MSYRMLKAAWFVTGMMVATTAGGCAAAKSILPSASKAFNVVVRIDSDSWSRAYGNTLPSLEVDLVGINESEKPTWENYPLGKYFSPDDPVRRDADRATLTFTSGDRSDKTLNRKHDVWGKWVGKARVFGKSIPGKGAKWLFIIANIPGVGDDQPGGQDPRRVVLPLRRNAWPVGTKEIEIVVKSSMMVCTTPLKAAK